MENALYRVGFVIGSAFGYQMALEGVEPSCRHTAADFKPAVSTSSTTGPEDVRRGRIRRLFLFNPEGPVPLRRLTALREHSRTPAPGLSELPSVAAPGVIITRTRHADLRR